MNSALHAALIDGAVVVTPNRRLARVLLHQFDLAQCEAGRHAWPTPTIVPYPTWLGMLWDLALQGDASIASELLLSPPQAAQLWRMVIDAESLPLLDPQGAAGLAAEAWTLVHEWGAGGESWRAWRREGDPGDDAAVFARWAEAYRSELKRAGAHDLSQIPAALAPLAERLVARMGPTILAGFTEFSPQQERLCAALRACGARVQAQDTLPAVPGAVCRTVAASPRAELAAALSWARERAMQRARPRIGIVIENLAAQRDAVVALAEELLEPTALVPGGASGPAPFEVSLGVPLAAVALVTAALDLVTLAQSRLTPGAAAALLRGPYLPDAERAWPARAAVERDWQEEGRREVSLGDAIAALESRSPELSARWRRGREALRRSAAASPREWVDGWRAWITAAGWPGSRPLDSDEYQAREAWEKLLGEFASLGAVSARLTPSAALDALRALASRTIFQPEGSAAPIQIMGVLEATGLDFDALWVAGLAADRWPAAPAPNPLLPIAWQRERNLPRASAQRELDYATRLTERFARAAPEIVFSSAASVDDHALAPSALILGFPERAPAAPAPTWTEAIARSAKLEAVADDKAPPIDTGGIAPHGSRIVASQSDCPFQAVARHRLGAEPWPPSVVGLSRAERGSLLHSALANFWSAIADQATLNALAAPALAAAVATAVEGALTVLPAARWRNVPPIVRAAETRRLGALVDAWLGHERARPPFAVREVEAKRTLQLGGLSFRLRLDRVDALATGGLAIIDYKTGQVEPPRQWFDSRPRSPQLGLYVLAQRAAEPRSAVHAVAYVQVQARGLAAVGLAADAAAWPGLATVGRVGPAGDWAALEAWWQRHLGALAAEIARGDAAVAPRQSPSPCRSCGLYAICRIRAQRRLDDDGADDA